ncbi:TPA: hypothetical protein ACYRM9_003705, partial [Proteus mirabilis]
DGTYLRTIDGQEVHYSDLQQVNNAADALEKLLKGINGISVSIQRRGGSLMLTLIVEVELIVLT